MLKSQTEQIQTQQQQIDLKTENLQQTQEQLKIKEQEVQQRDETIKQKDAELQAKAEAKEQARLAAIEASKRTQVTTTAAAPTRAAVFFDGGTVWDRLAQCESGGNWAINTGNGFYGGLQFDHGTWGGYGGYADAHLAPREVQIEKASQVQAARGFYPWPACASKLGLI